MSKAIANATGHKVLVSIRDGITLHNRWNPGQRMPTRRELAKELGATLVTVQRAIERLQRDGFVIAKGKLGTFVTDHPPHLANLAVVFRQQRESLFYTAMRQVITAGLGHSHRIKIYDDISSHADNEQYIQLVADMRARRIAGLIFAASPHHLAMTPLMDEPCMPRVAVASAAQDASIPAVYPDRLDFLRKAIAHLAAKGRRRPALLMAGMHPYSPFEAASQRFIETFETLGRKAGMTIEPWWVQGMSTDATGWAARHVQLLVHPNQKTRPDALIIADDNLVEHATGGLVAAGIDVPREMDVIAYTNFPTRPRSLTPVTCIGFDVRQIMRTCVEQLVSQREASPNNVPMTTLIPAMIEAHASSV